MKRRLGAEILEPRLALSANPLAIDPAATNDNSFSNATDLGFIDVSTTVIDNVERRDRNDFVLFTIRRDAVIDVDLSGLTGDVDLDFFDGRRRRIDRSSTKGLGNESVSLELTAGEYYVRVRSKPRVDSDYQLSIDVSLDPPPNQFEFVADYGGANDWNLNRINAPEVWNAGYTGLGVTVAIIDTGVDWAHQDLAGNIWNNAGETPGDGIDNDGNGFVDDIRGWDFVSDDADPSGPGSHGTHVAGTVAAERDSVGSTGVAYEASVMPVRVLGEEFGYYSDIAKGIRYAVDNGADIINLSLGGGFSFQVYSALRHAEANDVFVVAATGNGGRSRSIFPGRHSMNLSNVLSVGAYTIDGGLSSFSNGARGARDVQVDAPGSSIFSTLPADDYGLNSGTSMATPHVAGIAALIKSANADLNAGQIRDIIVAGATEYIAGDRARGGVNASASVLLATETTGSAVAESGATALMIQEPSEGQLSRMAVPSNQKGLAARNVTSLGGAILRTAAKETAHAKAKSVVGEGQPRQALAVASAMNRQEVVSRTVTRFQQKPMDVSGLDDSGLDDKLANTIDTIFANGFRD